MNEWTKKYLPHFILKRVAKGLMLVMCEKWVGDGDRLLDIDPKFFSTIAALLSSFCWAAQPWVTEGPSPLSGAGHPISNCDRNWTPSAWNWLTDKLELTQAVCGTWLYNCLMPTPASCGCTHLHRIQLRPQVKGDIPISSTGCTCFGCFSSYLHWCIS